MKKIISALVALMLMCSVLAMSAINANASEKKDIQEVLSEVQTQKGFIHGETAIVTGNCYAFVAKVCEQLYGVTYMGEGLYDSYKSYHRSGNFYTVDELITGESLSAATVEEMKNFFLENAYPGDIVHYGKPGGGTHTFMIQSVDEEKIVIFQANWPRRDLPYSSCHVDTIYWDSLVGATGDVYNEDGSLYSMNAVFANRMRGGSIGISINRYSNYEELYMLPNEEFEVAEVDEVTGIRTSVEEDVTPSETRYFVGASILDDVANAQGVA